MLSRRWRRRRERLPLAFASYWPALGAFGGVGRGGKPLLFAVITRAIPKARPSDAGRAMAADDVPVGVLADQVVKEQVLGDDGVAFHTHHLGDVGDAPRAVAQTGGLD